MEVSLGYGQQQGPTGRTWGPGRRIQVDPTSRTRSPCRQPRPGAPSGSGQDSCVFAHCLVARGRPSEAWWCAWNDGVGRGWGALVGDASEVAAPEFQCFASSQKPRQETGFPTKPLRQNGGTVAVLPKSSQFFPNLESLWDRMAWSSLAHGPRSPRIAVSRPNGQRWAPGRPGARGVSGLRLCTSVSTAEAPSSLDRETF